MPVTFLALGQGIYGGLQAVNASKNASDYQKKMEKLAANSPLAKRNPLIDNYAQEAANRYNENPYQSAFYQMAAQNARRATASGLNALNDRRSAIGGMPKLGIVENNALANAGVQAENYKERQFANMGRAAQMQDAQNKYLFDVNEMTPFNRKFGLTQMASQHANDQYNAGLQMAAQGIGNAASLYNAKQSNDLSKQGLDLQRDYYSGKLGSTDSANSGFNLGVNPQTRMNYGVSNSSRYPNYSPSYQSLSGSNALPPLTSWSPKLPRWNPYTGTYTTP